MAHAFSARPHFLGLSEAMFGFGEGADVGRSTAARIRAWSSEAVADNQVAGSIWSTIANTNIALLDRLSKADDGEINRFCHDLYASTLTYGFAQGTVVADGLRTSSGSRMHMGTIIADRFYRLAEAVGVARVKSGEHQQFTIEIGDLDGIFARIEDAIGCDLSPPRQNGAFFGLKLAKGVFSERHFDGIYGAWRMRQLARTHGIGDLRILEIGGGAGHLAYYARKLGARRYRIVDLPHVLLAQYILLSTEFEDVELGRQPGSGIGLIPAGTAEAGDFGGWPIVVNVDSLPEMPRPVATDYVRGIRAGQYLLSINQESASAHGHAPQNVVGELAAERGLARLGRSPSWLRTGYVEEVFTAPEPRRGLRALFRR